jgi:hypothetical protein
MEGFHLDEEPKVSEAKISPGDLQRTRRFRAIVLQVREMPPLMPQILNIAEIGTMDF